MKKCSIMKYIYILTYDLCTKLKSEMEQNMVIDNNEIRAFLFDLDGTLIDTESIYREIWPRAIKEMGYEMKLEQYLELRSLGRPYAPLKMKEWYGEDFDYDFARKIRKRYFDEHIKKYGIERKKGAVELLEHLRNNEITTAITTATDIDRATEYLNMTGLYGYFDKLISATMVDEGKPSPKVYLHALKELGLKALECIVVEDAPNGIISAYNAGLKVIMVPDQTGLEDYLEPMLYACVDSLTDIMEVIGC